MGECLFIRINVTEFDVILMIVFAVKLVHRNQELDDLYDEYDIPFDDEDDTDHSTRKKVSKRASDDDDDDGYAEYEVFDDDDEYDDDEYEDDDDDEDEEGLTTEITGKKDRKGSEDDYNIDFVDL